MDVTSILIVLYKHQINISMFTHTQTWFIMLSHYLISLPSQGYDFLYHAKHEQYYVRVHAFESVYTDIHFYI
jgi:hypothetical protein